MADYTLTEAGFGADLGAEKFCDIKCRLSGLTPDAAVVVATIRALKYNGGASKDNLKQENLVALDQGLPNLTKHIENLQEIFGLRVIVAINNFESDTKAEIEMVRKACKRLKVDVALTQVWEKGGAGGEDLAKALIDLLDAADNDPKAKHGEFKFAYDTQMRIEDKIRTVAQRVYGAYDIDISSTAKAKIKRLESLQLDKLPICIAKNPIFSE